MNCDCGKTGEFLLPCAHICSVVKEDKYFTPDTFHVRWHHHFSYSYANMDENDYTPRSTELMTEMFDDIRQNHYDKNGYYKGVCFSKTEVLKRLPRFIPEFRPNEKKNVMLKVMELSKKKPILVGRISVKAYIEFDIDQYYGGIEMPCDENFSSVTQEEFQNNLYLNNAALFRMKETKMVVLIIN